jgi:uncharacterized membrane protein
MYRNKLDFVEELVLSVALSFGLDGLVGLFLGLSPIGINFTSITISLSVLVLVFAVIVFIRRLREPHAAEAEPTASPVKTSAAYALRAMHIKLS